MFNLHSFQIVISFFCATHIPFNCWVYETSNLHDVVIQLLDQWQQISINTARHTNQRCRLEVLYTGLRRILLRRLICAKGHVSSTMKKLMSKCIFLEIIDTGLNKRSFESYLNNDVNTCTEIGCCTSVFC